MSDLDNFATKWRELRGYGLQVQIWPLLDDRWEVTLGDDMDNFEEVLVDRFEDTLSAMRTLVEECDVVDYARWVMERERQEAWDAAHADPPLIEGTESSECEIQHYCDPRG